MVTVIVPVGLPGAGKSTHMNELFEKLVYKHNKEVAFVGEPSILAHGLERAVSFQFGYPHDNKYDYFLIDVLIPDLDKLNWIKTYMTDLLKGKGYETILFEVHLFQPNVKWSIVNDFFRERSMDSYMTIINLAENWEFHTNAIVEKVGSVLIEHFRTHEPTREQRAIYDSKVSDWNVDDDFITSDPWSLGGWSRGIYDDGEMHPEEDPDDEFTSLKKFLKGYLGEHYTDEIYENTFKHVSIEEETYEEDWYAHYSYGYYQISTSEVLDLLEKMNIFSKES